MKLFPNQVPGKINNLKCKEGLIWTIVKDPSFLDHNLGASGVRYVDGHQAIL